MIEVVQYETANGRCPFADWFDGLDSQTALKARTVIARMEAGNFGDVKPIGDGVFERRIGWGPGYRIYFGRVGKLLVVLLAGGTKRRQNADIKTARNYWVDYKMRSKERQNKWH
jgi:putative addiction module killer protein